MHESEDSPIPTSRRHAEGLDVAAEIHESPNAMNLMMNTPAHSTQRDRGRLAFGVEPNTRSYRLRLARYAALAETLAALADSGRFDRDKPLRLLDAGAGNGRTMRYLEPYGMHDRIEFYAIEADPHRIEHLYGRERWASVKQIDLNDGIPFASDHFDAVVCEQVLEHLDAPGAVLKELVRVTRPGGTLIVGVPTYPPGLAAIRGSVVPRLDRLMGKQRGHSQVFTSAGLKRFVEAESQMRVDTLRGFRIASGGLLRPLEDFRWWYRVNRHLGQWLPGLCIECQAIATKTAATTSDAAPAAVAAAGPVPH